MTTDKVLTKSGSGGILPFTQFPVERLSPISNKPFDSVLTAIRGGVGHSDTNAFWEEIGSAHSFQRVESIVKLVLGPTGLMQFGEFDDGGFQLQRSRSGNATVHAVADGKSADRAKDDRICSGCRWYEWHHLILKIRRLFTSSRPRSQPMLIATSTYRGNPDVM